MDGQLMGDNIGQSRYELIHTTLVKFLETCTLTHLSPEQEERAKEYLKELSKTVYRSDSDTLQTMLPELVISSWRCWRFFQLLLLHMVALCALFDEQYVVMDGKAVLRDKKEVKADSLQNPND